MAAEASDAERLVRLTREHPTTRHPPGHRCSEGTHSRLADGTVLCWVVPGGGRYAVDGEIATQPVPRALAARWGSSDPGWVWPRWCAAEVVAKVSDTAILPLAAGGPVSGSPTVRAGVTVHWVVDRVDDLVVAHGLAATDSPAT